MTIRMNVAQTKGVKEHEGTEPEGGEVMVGPTKFPEEIEPEEEPILPCGCPEDQAHLPNCPVFAPEFYEPGEEWGEPITWE